MRTIEYSSAFKKNYKRLAGGRYRPALENELQSILRDLIHDRKLEQKHHDHELLGDWHGYRECHVKADLLLIYSLPDAKTLRLARLGTHSDLF